MPLPVRCALAALLVVCCCAAPAAAAYRHPRIVGGTTAPANAFPYAAELEFSYSDGSTGYCGGALVAARYVVTAGHCLEDSPTRVDAAIGTSHVDHAHTLASGQSTVPASDQYLNDAMTRDPNFADDGNGPRNDAAVITLSRPAPVTQARLARTGDGALWAPGVTATAIGWGCTSNLTCTSGAPVLPDDLREVQLPIRPNRDCLDAYGAFDGSSQICAGGQTGEDTCNGDSGGPLLVPDGVGDLVLAAATSFGSDICGSPNVPGVYTALGQSLVDDWVRSIVPQVEIDASTAVPVPGQVVTFTARPSDPVPGASGPFGGYTSLSWDLNGDGQFGDVSGSTTASATMVRGVDAVSVRAADGLGDDEVRTIRLRTVDRSLIAFARRHFHVREGHVVHIALTRIGVGGGTVTMTPKGRAARKVTFTGSESGLRVRMHPHGNRRPQRNRHIHLSLGRFTGALIAGSPATATLTVVDDDASVRTRRVRVHGDHIRVAVRSNRGRLGLKARAHGVTVARAARRKLHGGLRTRHITLHLTAAGRHMLAPGSTLRSHVTASFTPTTGGHATHARRTVTVRD